MTRAVAIERDGGTFLVELADSPHVVVTSATGEGTAGVADLIERLDNVAATVAGVCTSLYEKAYQALGTMRPDEFELEFGVTLAGEAWRAARDQGNGRVHLQGHRNLEASRRHDRMTIA